jgi:hypothetical protein
VSNYGARAILALSLKRRRKVPTPDEADLRWLIALETFPPDDHGWRRVGAELLADAAGLAYSTSRQARDRLVTAGLVEYRKGNGRGHQSSYRFAVELKVPDMSRHLSDDKGAETGDVKVPRPDDKGAEHNPATSENAEHGLEAFGLDSYAATQAKWPAGRPVTWPSWCGDSLCQPITSLRETPDGRPAGRCPVCHPRASRRAS